MMAEVDVETLPDSSKQTVGINESVVDVSKALSIVAISDKFWERLAQLDGDKRAMLTMLPNLATFFEFWRKKAGENIEPGVQCTFQDIKSHWVKSKRMVFLSSGSYEFQFPTEVSVSPSSMVADGANPISNPTVKGFLMKKGHINTAFKMRWCQLHKNLLTYRVEESDQNLRGCANCDDCSIVSSGEIEEAFGEHSFGLLTPFDKKHLCWIFKADSREAMHDWVEALKVAGGVNDNGERATSLLLRPTELEEKNQKCIVS